MPISSRVEQEREYLIQLRRYFHQHPELSMKEYQTADKIEEELDRFHIPHRRIGETGVYAVIKGKHPGKRIVLRADMDALAVTDKKTCDYASQNAGVMHACGHDAHTAALLGAAKLLKEKEETIQGEIGLIFQQGEEYGQGARLFVKEGLLEHTDRVFGIHVASNVLYPNVAIKEGPVNASVDHVTITVTGETAHVSTPHLGVDALYVASQIVCALQGIVSRGTDPLDTVVVGIGKLTAGTAYNVVAKTAVLEGTIRCFLPETREKTRQQVIDIANGIAAAYHAKVEVEITDFAAPLINDPVASREAAQVAATLVGSEHVVPREKSLGGDDFADYLQKVPGVYAYVGTGNTTKPDTLVPQHRDTYDIEEEALLTACALYVEYAQEVLTT